jgi:hypothetical protein
MNRERVVAWTLFFAMFVVTSSCSHGVPDEQRNYLPSVNNGDGSYRFSETQLKEMVRTPLDQGLFLRYVEAKWPLDKLKAYCATHKPMPRGYQNLVAEHRCFNESVIPIHKGEQHGFDRIYVYVNDDEGKSNYYGSLATEWRRWEYSLNLVQGKDHWSIIESLPNDFMDNSTKYVPQRQGQTK